MNKKTSNGPIKLGIIAGGQLGKMLALAASNWGIETIVMDDDKDCPAAQSCSVHIFGSRLSYEDIISFADNVDLIVCEIEHVNVEALQFLKKSGVPIFPDPDILTCIQDKGLQKDFYKKENIPTSAYHKFENSDSLKQAIDKGLITYPFVQKLCKGGYDGNGVSVINSVKDLDKLFTEPSIVEDKVDILKEISVIVARNKNEEVKCFPVTEMEISEHSNLMEKLICPANLPEKILIQAEEIAIKLIEKFNMVGLLAVEMFVDKDQNLWLNEIAPRPHNSGHHTMDSVITSQYEQLLRAVLNYPLGSVSINKPSVMLNILGSEGFTGIARYEGLEECMGIDGVKVHLYGKKETRPNRKMGHLTILGNDLADALKKADQIKGKLRVVS